MSSMISAHLNKVNFGIILAVFALIPLVFTPFTTEYYESAKLVFLVSATLLLLLLTVLGWIIAGKMEITRTPFDLPLILIGIIFILSTVFSPVQQISILGSLPKVNDSLAAWISYIMIYFLVVWNIRSAAQLKLLFYTLLGSSVIVSSISILFYFGIYQPLDKLLPVFMRFANFTPAGSSFSAAALALLLIPLPIISLIRTNKFLPNGVALITGIIFALTIVLIGDLAIFLGTVVTIITTLFVVRAKEKGLEHQTSIGMEVFKKYRLKVIGSLSVLVVPIALALAILGLGYIPENVWKGNPFLEKRMSFPREVRLPFNISWKVAASSFRDKPFLGTGPSTFAYDFTAYKPVEFNSLRFWNSRFDNAFNEFLHFFATVGALGMLALTFLAVLILTTAIRLISTKENLFTTALSISALAIVTLLALHTTTVTMITVSMLLLALLMANFKFGQFNNNPVDQLTVNFKSETARKQMVLSDLFPTIVILLPVILFVLYVAWNSIPLVMADYHHRMALNNASVNGISTYNNLVRSVQLNPRSDLYRIDLAQTNFALANAIARAKGPTESSPGGSLTEEDKANIQRLIQQSIQAGQASVALNPLSTQNWEVLGALYRQVSGVASNALNFSLDAYGKAIQRDPLNPLLRLSAGGVYYSAKNYDLAVRFFTDSVNLKPDFANGYYNLSVALKDKGDLKNAALAAEKVVSLLDPAVPDYKTASNFLAELKGKLAESGDQRVAGESATVPPAALEKSALEKKDLPDVINLPKKEDITTPSAVKKDPKARVEVE